jgi:hypothetical protein
MAKNHPGNAQIHEHLSAFHKRHRLPNSQATKMRVKRSNILLEKVKVLRNRYSKQKIKPVPL